MHSLQHVYDLFKLKLEDLQDYPNIRDFSSQPQDSLTSCVIEAIEKTEKMSLSEISDYVHSFSKSQPGGEAIALKFNIVDDGSFEEAAEDILSHEEETEYYNRILSAMLEKISDEFAGKNEYDKPQTVFSRRFIHTENTCISMIHALYRENLLEMTFNVRSTNVEKTFPYDLEFAYFLSSKVYQTLGLIPRKNACVIRFVLNSAHVVW